MIRVSKNFESDEQYADELEKNIVQEILPGDDDSNAPLKEPPTLSEFIKSIFFKLQQFTVNGCVVTVLSNTCRDVTQCFSVCILALKKSK